jgi:hypothetical protein
MYLLLLWFGSSLWVFFDAKKIGAKKGLVRGSLDGGPGQWFTLSLVCPVLGFLMYLSFRSKIKKINQGKKVRPFLEEQIRLALDQGEYLLAKCDFIDPETDRTFTAGITNKNLRYFFVLKRNNGRDGYSISNTAIGISRISAIQDSKVVNGNLNVFRINIWWENKTETLDTIDSEGEAFIKELKHVLALREGSTLASTSSISDELEKLYQLAKEGIINDDEWTRAKEMYLGKPLDKREQSIQTLRKLYDLHETGVLSKSEFNTKKWEILSKKDIS